MPDWMLKSNARVLLLVAIPCCASLLAGFFIVDYVIMEAAANAHWDTNLLACNFDIDATNLTDGWLPSFLQRFHLQFFRPGVVALFKLDWQLYHLWAPGYHLTNILLHLLMTYSVIHLVRPWVGDQRKARLAGLIFGLTPHSISAVIWVSGRTSLMDSLFVVWSYLAFRRYHQTGSRWAAAGSVLALIAGLLCKESALIGPLLVAACMPKRPWRKAAFWLLPAVAAVYLGGRALVWGWGSFPMLPSFDLPHEFGQWIRYFWVKTTETLLSLTTQLPAFHMIHAMAMKSVGLLIGLSVAALIVFLTMFIRLRRHPAGWWLLAWCALSCAITFPIPPMAHYLYLAQAGMALGFVIFWEGRPGDRRWFVCLGRGAWWTLLIAGALCYVLFSLGSRLQDAMVTAARNRMTAAASSLEEGGTIGLVDIHIFQINLAPAFRLQSGRDDVKVVAMCPANDYRSPEPSQITYLDDHTVRLRANGKPYLTSLVETVLLSKVRTPDLAPGMGVDWPDPAYRLEVVAVGRRTPPLPTPVLELQYRFQEPIDGRHVTIVRCIQGWEMGHTVRRLWDRLAGKGGIE
jgi:hypothetical protein